MNLSPTVRSIMTAVAAALAALAVVLPTLGAPVWVAAIIGVVLVTFGALGIVPPQTGGTQQGVVSPAVVDVPPSENIVTAEPPVVPPAPPAPGP